MVGNAIEVELKAEVEPSALQAIARQVAKRTGKSGQVGLLRSIYFDTDDHRLREGGISLRIRREGGRTLQTVKADRTSVAGFHQVREVETRHTGLRPRLEAIPDRALALRIAGLAGGKPLVVQFETRVRRASYRVVERHGVVAVALDRGVVRANGVEEVISELELELEAGTPEALFDLAESLLGGVAARLDQPNKAERGYRLLAKGKPAAVKLLSKPTPPPPGASARDAFAAALGELVSPIASALHQTLVADDPEGPHQLRVGLRRLRTVLRLYKPMLDPKLANEIAVCARDMGQQVSPLRDADVLLPDLLVHTARESEQVAERLRLWHMALRKAVRANLLEGRATALPLALMRISALEVWAREDAKRLDRPMLRAVEPALESLWARIGTAGGQLAGLDDESQHEFRKNLKKLRYSLEFLPKSSSMKPFVSALKRLQEALGTLNDLVVLADFAPPLAAADKQVYETVRAKLLETSRHKSDLALGRACRHWRALIAVPVPWREPK